MSPRTRILAPAIVGALACSSCSQDGGAVAAAEPDSGVTTPPVALCYRCHGDPSNGNNAPPPSSWAPDAGPDAHQRHLQSSSWRAAVPCSACHIVPDDPDDPGHVDDARPAELTWGERASAQGATPSYEAAGRSCQGVYCHGATLSAGAASTTAEWDRMQPPEESCGSRCHDNPPPAPHPTSEKCHDCHGAVVDAAGAIAAPALHIDGELEVDEVACTFCHGDASGPDEPVSWAPPLDTGGNLATTFAGVGAHREHLASTDWHAPMPCEACHEVPTTVVVDGHIDAERPAELTWGALAKTAGAQPSYDGDRCTGGYCHGATLGAGGTNSSPRWTLVDGSQDECGTCHGLPPTNSWHPFVRDPSTCSPCHPYTGHLPDAPAIHINGFVDHVEPLECGWCHGSESSPAPPTDCSGQSDTSLASVGAHQSHVLESPSTFPIPCTECHIEPSHWIAMGHRDGSPPAEVWFGPLAQTGGRLPAWDGVTCAETYCHDSNPLDLNPSKVGTPTWTTVDGSEGACDSCHGYPPWTDTHPVDAACGDCHPLVVGPDHVTITDKSLHLNGLPEE